MIGERRPSRSECLQLLGLTDPITQAQLRQAYHRLAHRYHPDHHRNDPVATRRFVEVAKAYKMLSRSTVTETPRRSRPVGRVDRLNRTHRRRDRRRTSPVLRRTAVSLVSMGAAILLTLAMRTPSPEPVDLRTRPEPSVVPPLTSAARDVDFAATSTANANARSATPDRARPPIGVAEDSRSSTTPPEEKMGPARPAAPMAPRPVSVLGSRLNENVRHERPVVWQRLEGPKLPFTLSARPPVSSPTSIPGHTQARLLSAKFYYDLTRARGLPARRPALSSDENYEQIKAFVEQGVYADFNGHAFRPSRPATTWNLTDLSSANPYLSGPSVLNAGATARRSLLLPAGTPAQPPAGAPMLRRPLSP